MARLNELVDVLNEIKEKHHQYGVEHFLILKYRWYIDDCDIETDKYLIDFKNRVVYVKTMLTDDGRTI